MHLKKERENVHNTVTNLICLLQTFYFEPNALTYEAWNKYLKDNVI